MERTAADLVLTGKSAAHRIDSDLTNQTWSVEGYVRTGDLEAFVRRHLLSADENGDVTIYERTGELGADGNYAPDAVIAADLARSTATRERTAAIAALEKMRHQWLATHTR
jgi:hypothetical protein